MKHIYDILAFSSRFDCFVSHSHMRKEQKSVMPKPGTVLM